MSKMDRPCSYVVIQKILEVGATDNRTKCAGLSVYFDFVKCFCDIHLNRDVSAFKS